MRKLLLLITLLTVTHTRVSCQVTIQPNLPVTGMLQNSQLWNVLVINGSGQQYDCRLNVVIHDRGTGEEVLSAISNQFSIQKGSKQLNINLLNPVQYNYAGSSAVNGRQGFIPVGSYTICYTLSQVPSNETYLSEECVSFDAEPLSPPMLIFPADSSELDAAPTQFTWTPPTPAGMFDMLQYDILITEIFAGQNPGEAIEENLPFYSGNQPNSFFNYPASSISFLKEKWYAWQVIAKDNKSYAAKSEAWVFKVKPLVFMSTVVEQSPFIKMKKGLPEKGIAPNGTLKISYINETADSTATIVIYDQNNLQKAVAFLPVKLRAGENLLQYELKKFFPVAEGNIYEAQLINSRKEKWVVQFESRNYEMKKNK